MAHARRVSKACDHCREAKSKCDKKVQGKACKRCEECHLDCTSAIPARRRGPPKGYLHLVETQMHELEAVIGVILSIPDPSIQKALETLSQDEFASGVLNKVSSSPFGPLAIRELAAKYPVKSGATSPPPKATNAWQLHALENYLSVQKKQNPPADINLSLTPLYRFENASPLQELQRVLSSSSSTSSSELLAFPPTDAPIDDAFLYDWMSSPTSIQESAFLTD